MKNLRRAFKAFQALDHKFPINAALALLYIADHEPCLKQDMETALDFSTATGSRCTDYLCTINRLRKPGPGFILKEENFQNRRQSVLSLTDKGRHFLQSIAT